MTSYQTKGYFISLYLLISVFLLTEGTLFPLHAAKNRATTNEQAVKNSQTVKEIFSYIEQNSNFVILYSKGLLSELEKKVSISTSGKKAEEILKELSNVTNLGYKISDRQVMIVKKAPAPEAKQQNADIKVTGQVFDELGETIPGANVTVKGNSGIGVVTDMDGNFTISVPKGSTLLVSFIGYTTYEHAAKDGEKLIVKLVPDSKTLDEVVVVGYGMQRKSAITGSIASVKSDKLKDVTTPSVANMLQGKVAGVSVSPLSGQPGSGSSIRIRGTGSIMGNQNPLWVIDGVVGNAIAELNPNDIESISILKDGSAAALYGSRGANGVIQVTTKRGTSGASSIDASVKFGVSTLQKGNLEMMNGAEYYDYLVEAYTNRGEDLPKYLQPYLRDMNTDWWDIATQNALTQNYNIAYKYGNDKVRSYISADYYNEEGAIKGFDYDRFTLRVNTDYIVNKRLTLKAKLSTSYKETDNKEHSLSYYSYSPWDTPYTSKGKMKTGKEAPPTSSDEILTADPRDYWYSDGNYNYLSEVGMNWTKNRTNAMDIGLGFDYKIFDFLTFESNNKFGFNNSYTDKYTDPESTSGTSLHGSFEDGYVNSRSIYTSQMFRFLKTFNEVHEFNAFMGYDYDEYRYYDAKGTANNIYPGAEILNAGAGTPEIKGTRWEEKNAAYFLNVNYAYDSKYLFQVMFRVDGSSRFGANKRWAPFWSIGGGWNMHKEEFMKGLSFINELKPRISYGITGNLPQSAYEWTTKFGITNEYASQIAFMSNYSGNPNLSWEETATLDYGLDIRLFDRVGITFDGYSKKVKNLIYLRHLSAVTGFNRQTANDGKLKNTGFEFTVTPEIIRNKDLYWDVSFNLGYNKNEVTHLPNGDDLIMQATAVGYPLLNWYMKEWAGVDAMTGTPLWFKVDENGQKTATGNWNDATDVLLDASASPKFTGGISTNLTWKGFSLNANFIFSSGAKIYNGMRAGSLDRDAARPTQPPMKLADGWSRWEKPGDIATHPQLIKGGNKSASDTSTRYLENGDFFKLKSLSISYSLPDRWIKTVGLKAARISVGGENLFTITKYSGDDPEILLSTRFKGGTSVSDGSKTQLYPTVRRFTLGVNLNF